MKEEGDATKNDAPTPMPEVAEVLQMLEAQRAARFGRGPGGGASLRQGAGFRYGVLVVIVVATLGAAWVMEWLADQLKRPGTGEPGMQAGGKARLQVDGSGAGGE